jgi:hypothetical protein
MGKWFRFISRMGSDWKDGQWMKKTFLNYSKWRRYHHIYLLVSKTKWQLEHAHFLLSCFLGSRSWCVVADIEGMSSFKAETGWLFPDLRPTENKEVKFGCGMSSYLYQYHLLIGPPPYFLYFISFALHIYASRWNEQGILEKEWRKKLVIWT